MDDLSELRHAANGIRYSDDVKEIAYQLWAFATARNASEVARRLKEEEWGGHDVERGTVAYWAREYKWAERATQEVRSIAPDLRYQTFSELLFGAHEGAKYIRRVAAGQEDAPEIIDILTDEQSDSKDKQLRIEARIKSHDAARKARISAAIAAVDRIGFSPVGKGLPGVEAPDHHKPLADFSTMTIDELRAYELQLRRSS